MLISVVIPTYNSALYIEDTLKSVFAQGWENLEVIVMDDGSTDNTLSLLRSLAENEGRLRVFQQPNGKPAKARNNAIREAKGEWIAFIDSDDIWLPGKLDFQLAETLKYNADLSFTNGYVCLNNNMELRDHLFRVEQRIYEGEEGVQLFHQQNRIPTSSVLVKAEVFRKYGFMPEYPEYPMYCEDYLFWTRLLHNGCRFVGLEKPLLLYRVHTESTIGDEIRLLSPLIQVLFLLPGKRGLPWKQHLEKSAQRYIEILTERNKMKDLDPLVSPIVRSLYTNWKAALLTVAWTFSNRLFISLFWRMREYKT